MSIALKKLMWLQCFIAVLSEKVSCHKVLQGVIPLFRLCVLQVKSFYLNAKAMISHRSICKSKYFAQVLQSPLAFLFL